MYQEIPPIRSFKSRRIRTFFQNNIDFPLYTKKKFQVDELLKNEVIKSSQTRYNTPGWIVSKKTDSKGIIKC